MPSFSRGADRKERNNLVRRNLKKEAKHPFVIYADFECISEATDSPVRVRKHVPTSFGYCVVDWKKTIIRSDFGHGENVVAEFYKSLIKTEEWLKCYLKVHGQKMLKMNSAIEFDFENAKECWICRKELLNDRVKDHCHLTGKYRGAAHNECNLFYNQPKRIPVLFHNLKNYDGHLLIEGINAKIFNTEINLIAQTMEKYIGWFSGNFAFLDSFAFLPASLNTLSNDLSQEEKYDMLRQHWKIEDLSDLCGKAALPYEYLDSYEKYDEEKLPPIECFYSSLTDSNITDEMYHRLERIWKQFDCRTMKDLIDIYLKLDVYMLAAVFENFRETSIKDFGIDPPHYMSVPGLSINSAVKMLGIDLELFIEIDMYLMIENGIRGGFTTTVKRHAVAENSETSANISPEQETWLLYLDVNNLYGHAMMQMLPIGDYNWVRKINFENIMATSDEADKGYILEVDLEYPKELHDSHNDFPLAPHKMVISHDMLSPFAKNLLDKMDYKHIPTEKLVASFFDRKNYVVHYRVLKYYIAMGLKVTHVHRAISFRQKSWLKPYIEFCTKKRQQASSPFISSLYKLFVNSNYGKLMEDKRKRVKVDLVMKDAMAARRVRDNFCKSMKILDEEKILFQMTPDTVLLDKPIVVGFTVLELAKLHVYNLYYGVLKAHYQENLQLIYSDTDSLLIEIKSNSLNQDMAKFSNIMDFSDLPKDHPLYSEHNKKKIGCLKDEMSGEVIDEVIAIRPKLYAIKTTKGQVKKKAKGVQQVVLKNKLTFEDYRTSLFNNGVIKAKTRRLGSESHTIYQYVNEKIALSPFEDKRYLLDSVNSLAYGHYKIE
ncbi:uncharacterized protein LOC107359368 [Tetranychus urticae]|uniref:uncharacterized protein LOC107359368 n=1 Tax=Tetranychus urticae TaxID=32264 RepID=UPI00077B9B56|nr:uncharacterized protein LOC107359368 [Tetranychus urticae]